MRTQNTGVLLLALALSLSACGSDKSDSASPSSSSSSSSASASDSSSSSSSVSESSSASSSSESSSASESSSSEGAALSGKEWVSKDKKFSVTIDGAKEGGGQKDANVKLDLESVKKNDWRLTVAAPKAGLSADAALKKGCATMGSQFKAKVTPNQTLDVDGKRVTGCRLDAKDPTDGQATFWITKLSYDGQDHIMVLGGFGEPAAAQATIDKITAGFRWKN